MSAPTAKASTCGSCAASSAGSCPSSNCSKSKSPACPATAIWAPATPPAKSTCPCLVESVYEGIDALRQIARVLDPTKGVGSLRVRLPDGTVRQIGATYAGGLDASREENPHAIWAPLVFRTPDPYWTDGVEQTAQAPAGATSAEVVNDGDYETWPVIHLAAPAAFANPVLTNTAVNQKIDIRATGRDMIIDCRPGYRSVVIDGRPNYAALTQDSELWPLVAGSQTVTFAAAPLNFTTTASWTERYLAI